MTLLLMMKNGTLLMPFGRVNIDSATKALTAASLLNCSRNSLESTG
ncbi:hypothetical protein [Nostoc commune]|nr:hypothetical protein [Nostoc commune]